MISPRMCLYIAMFAASLSTIFVYINISFFDDYLNLS